MALPRAAGICPVITDIEACSCPATTDSRPMKSGRLRNAERYSRTGYWNSWTVCQRHMLVLVPLGRVLRAVLFGLPVVPFNPTLPLMAAPPTLCAHVACGLLSGAASNGYAGVARAPSFGPPAGVRPLSGLPAGMPGNAGSSTRVQLRLPLPPWPACTNQSRPQGVSSLSVAFFTSFCIEIEPSEQVVWLWKSPET